MSLVGDSVFFSPVSSCKSAVACWGGNGPLYPLEVAGNSFLGRQPTWVSMQCDNHLFAIPKLPAESVAVSFRCIRGRIPVVPEFVSLM
jgi:hypothetical protein